MDFKYAERCAKYRTFNVADESEKYSLNIGQLSHTLVKLRFSVYTSHLDREKGDLLKLEVPLY